MRNEGSPAAGVKPFSGILPVLDLMDGRIVRGIAGRRDTYRPIRSALCRDAEPESVARALVAHFGFQHSYIADLNAISGAEPAWDTYRQLASCGLELWIDAGLRGVERALALAAFEPCDMQLHAIIAGLESVPDPDTLADLLACVGPRRFVFSLDLHGGQPWNRAPAWQTFSPDAILQLALRIGIQRYTILDLADVGMGRGVSTETLCRTLRRRAPHVQITSGGGVRDMQDVQAALAWGCDFVLVASALHDGRIFDGLTPR
jgi:phosphoribosylformimino-5-aminoimidazole carboxamide ribotide isomerase